MIPARETNSFFMSATAICCRFQSSRVCKCLSDTCYRNHFRALNHCINYVCVNNDHQMYTAVRKLNWLIFFCGRINNSCTEILTTYCLLNKKNVFVMYYNGANITFLNHFRPYWSLKLQNEKKKRG